ncbi:hypothetical protein C9J12_17105 [Photobacterium frigidiphilum]|uniref:Uncharacterized protein n=1 Tax=Photobacterium frigidiphilum TaxID=264736 RepID=A0A2T3JDG0_9GAMM|nr:hypothetical protein [Photobacterium frigidiphilum]PSU46925.1 hypothetical protein C9J12_17105 [Photobacterium frigidiphilum]
MLAESREFILLDSRARHANIRVIPTGVLEVSIEEGNDKMQAEFAQLLFSSSGKKTGLVCRNSVSSNDVNWHLELSNADARELSLLIEQAEEEFEILMRDL